MPDTDSQALTSSIKPSEIVTPQPSCLNCGTPKPDEDAFCRKCGQKHTKLNDGLGSFVIDFITSFVSIDGRAFRTLTTLMFKPGKCTVDFSRGRRSCYLSTAQTYLFSGFFFFMVLGNWIDVAKIEELFTVNMGQERVSLAELNRGKAAGAIPHSEGMTLFGLSEDKRPDQDSLENANIGSGTPSRDKEIPNEVESASNPETETSGSGTPEDTSFVDKVHSLSYRDKPLLISLAQFRQFAVLSPEDIRAFFLNQGIELNSWEVELFKRSAIMTTDHGFASYVSGSVSLASQLALLMLPLLAFLVRISHWRTCRSWLIAFVFSAHWHASMYLAISVLMLFNVSLLGVGLIGGAVGVIYWLASLRIVFGQNWLIILVKTVFLAPMYGFGLFLGFAVAVAGSIFLF
ncbi:MAG: DUF3667 domain-containing protein [Planctomycetaceae bacterium]|nr:DUF3667 domain-containing protein [Planctomycetaceae bacterium]